MDAAAGDSRADGCGGVTAIRNILTFDVEDWYQGLEIAPERWRALEKRLPIGLGFILDTLAEFQTRATFFVLGAAAAEHPDCVRRIAAAGHEIGTHGWSHARVYHQNPRCFAEELRRSLTLLEDLSGRAVRGHRAAMFSITGRSLWALDAVADAGLAYDASIFPVHNYRYGLPAARTAPHRLREHGDLWELPPATIRLAGLNVPVGGGFYARFWARALLSRAIAWHNRRGQPAVFYFHPWEFDPGQPRGGAGARGLARATHYFRLAGARETLRYLLAHARWHAAEDFVLASTL